MLMCAIKMNHNNEGEALAPPNHGCQDQPLRRPCRGAAEVAGERRCSAFSHSHLDGRHPCRGCHCRPLGSGDLRHQSCTSCHRHRCGGTHSRPFERRRRRRLHGGFNPAHAKCGQSVAVSTAGCVKGFVTPTCSIYTHTYTRAVAVTP